MINVLVPMAGSNLYFPESSFPYPKPLIEIGGKTMIELVVSNLSTAADNVQFIFVVNSDDCSKYHLDSTLNIICDNDCHIIRLEKETKGSACSALMAIEYIANGTPLLISNADQVFNDSISNLIDGFYMHDAGVLSFDSVHPRWSYVRVDDQERVVETAEKRPLSRNAIAGLYFYRRGDFFVESAMQMIRKDESVSGSYFVSPTLNQLILDGRTVGMNKIANDSYHTFYTPQKIKEFERLSGYETMSLT